MLIQQSSGATRLLAEIRKVGDFPALAHTVDVISSMTYSESTGSSALADTILHDYGLTQKLLRMVNTLGYRQYGEVTTVTRAVLLMGFERIRNIATSLILFEHFRHHARTKPLVDLLNKAFFSGVLCRNIAQTTGYADGEEAFLTGLYHRIGQVLTAFYLPKDYASIQAVPVSERSRRTVEVLGSNYEMLGATIARELHLPEVLQESLSSVSPNSQRRLMMRGERLSCLATLSNEMTDVIAAPGKLETRRQELDQLVAGYGAHITLPENLDDLLKAAATEARTSATTFKLHLAGTPLMARLGHFASGQLDAGEDGAAESASGDLIPEEEDPEPVVQLSPEVIVTQGLHEVTALLVGDYSFDDVLRVVLETIYRALGVGRTRVLFLLKDPSKPILRFRFGFGHTPADATAFEEVVLAGTTDFLSQSVVLDKDIIVRNARIPSVAQALPPWLLKKGVLDRYLLLLPLTIERRAIGLFYIDGEKAAGSILSPSIINYLKLLRGQVVLAIKRKRSSAQS
jgi:HD-like signal output (HDOD) protein